MDELDRQFEEHWQRDGGLCDGADVKDIARLWFLKGRGAGLTEGMKLSLPISAEDSIKLENATIGEHFNHELYIDVLRTRRQTE